MKFARKLFAMLLCLTIILGMATTAFAYTVELTGTLTAGHTYKVYQIFTGDLAEIDGETVLSNVLYGKNYGTEGKPVDPELLARFEEAGGKAVAKEVADAITGEAYGTLEDPNWKLTDVPAGYYLIKDVTDLTGEETNNSLSEYIIQVVEDVSMAPKADNIIPDKEIASDNYDDNLETDDSVHTDAESSNGGIGSTVNFVLTVDVPVNADSYSYYYCVLNDTLSEGLTFNNDVVVKVNGVEVVKDSDYKLYTGEDADPYTFQIAMLNAKTLGGKTITATYSAEINKDAIIGVVGNPNAFDVDYSNDPNYDYAEEPGNDGKPDNDKDAPIGTTPEIITKTFVTGVQLKKIDGATNKALTGAEFKLTGTSIKSVIVTGTDYVESETGTYYKLKDGTYTEEAPITEEGYVAKTAAEGRDGGYVLKDGKYEVATAEDLKGTVQLYKKVFPNSDLYDSTDTMYELVDVDVVKPIHEDVEISAFVDENGILQFVGLGEGVYTISEITVPAGYNKIEDITLTIDWTAPETIDGNCTWEATMKIGKNGEEQELALVNQNGANEELFELFEMEIVNQKGSTLPETGGMGTTLFYVIGSVMVLAAVILLVTKKRMSVAE